MHCKFEETEYREPLNYELAQKWGIWPIGQVLENSLGFDAAFFSNNLVFWSFWPLHKSMIRNKGLILSSRLWNNAKGKLNSSTFPKFKINLFVQHKVPEYISSKLGKEFRNWNQPYFRYNITKHQQYILEKLEAQTNKNALVVYACPCFYERTDLFNFYRGKMIINSNFVEPSKLTNHKRYTFIKKGIFGQPFSDPIKIETLNIMNEIEKKRRETKSSDNNVRFINELAKI